ncbi:hypothetical protein [Heyndrickxia oleronia]|uniref:Uncharacterized protein n=1 Tax=Heyndrickxia oleronia TaxID=38875 RepID=A0AAW6T3Z6_9BACI|nr:hypothetical protein [Heyndrickxia oleronia]MDH5163399.1 hypothetical protein [Heyndrickxia oleronia]
MKNLGKLGFLLTLCYVIVSGIWGATIMLTENKVESFNWSLILLYIGVPFIVVGIILTLLFRILTKQFTVSNLLLGFLVFPLFLCLFLADRSPIFNLIILMIMVIISAGCILINKTQRA